MTITNLPNENNQDSSNTYAWIAVAVFTALILCFSIVFCGLGLWAIRNSTTSETQSESEASESQENILQEIGSDPAWKLLVNDEFTNNKNRWEVGAYLTDFLTLDRSIEDGKYILDFQSSTGWTYWSFPDIEILEDFVASVEIKHSDGNLADSFGLILRASYDDYYLFQINENNRASFFIYTLDKYTTLMDISTSAVKIGEVNEITVRAEGSHFTFYVNNTKVGEIDDDRLASGYAGILTSPSGLPSSKQNLNSNTAQQRYPSTFEVDNFKIWELVAGNIKLESLTPEQGRIAFVSDKDGNSEIYSINTDGTDMVRLTDNKADDLSPKWSPDGSKITFISTRDGNSEIYVMNSDGLGIIRITNDKSDDIDPSWSPDGQKIVFSSNRDGDYEIYIHNLETGTDEQITENTFEDRYPDWSSKNDVILYQSLQYGSSALYMLDISTEESERITPRIPPYSDSRSSFSKDGSKIVYAAGSYKNQTGIMIYDLDTKMTIDVVIRFADPTNKKGENLSPTWSANDEQIAFVSSRDGQIDIYIISSDGKSIFRVTNTETNEWDLDWTEN
ncbi:MAG: PD40 domain-containing protein [Anaerolineales bacterium]|nr:PD40 domain-containing protein [Anaerolineales bacterium]